MGKHSVVEDKIPLTHTRSNITYETRARFDSLLQAAVGQERDNAVHLQENHDNVDEVGKFPQKHTKRSGACTKGADRDSPGRAFSKSVEGTACKSHNMTIHNLSSGFDLLSSSDDDVVMKQRLNGHLLEHEKVNSELRNDKNRELLFPDKKLKDERNSCQISQQKEAKIYSEKSRGNEADVIKVSTRIKNIQSDSSEEYADFSHEKQVSPSCRNSRCVKKPVPLPRRKTQKEFLEPGETLKTEADECHQQFVRLSNSLNTELPVDGVEHTGVVADGDNDCVLPQNVERKEKKKKKSIPCSVDENEEIELRNIKTTPDVELDRIEVSPNRKSSFHKSRRKSGAEAVDTVLMMGESQQMELSYDRVLGIIIHRSECLQVDPLIRHPLVKVHLINAATGSYLKKSNVNRPVSFYYENREVDYILPLMTDIFDYKEKRSIVPVWEELLVFNEDFEYVLHGNPPVLILFEVLDIVNFTVASSQYQKLGSEGGWHHIAWAFLKPVGANGVLNTEKEVRLQLYKPRRMRKLSCNSCDVYEWWSAGVWERYPATLYVTVKGIVPPEHLPPVLRSRSALQGELNQSSPSLALGQNHREGDARSDQENSVLSSQLLQSACTSLPTWSRLPSQSCKIPNHRKLALPTAARGCFTVKFSNSGLHLACSMSSEEKYIIIVYSVPEGKELAQLVGHQGLVYDLQWSPKDTLLLSASADCTACLWDTEGQKSRLLQMLPHPSFVYCGQFHPSNGCVLATGCHDHVVRVWSRLHRSSQFELVQELEGHSGFITAMSMSCSGMLYSGDSIGRIIEWTTSKVKSKKQCCKWKLNRNMDIRELRDTVVNRLQVHPGGQRLLVHARDSRLRMLDITTASVIQWFNGALNHRVQTSACLTPCGGLVLAASEDNTVHVWNADTGEQLAIYSGLQFYQGASGVDYHPFEHMVAFASYGSDACIVVCDYDKLSSGKDIGLQMLVPQDVTLQATVGDTAESYMKSSTPLPSGISSLKEKKENLSVSDSEMEVFQGSSLLATDTNGSSLSPNTMNAASPVTEYDSKASKARLASIIEKMDHVLSKTQSKSSQKVSEIFSRSLDQKLNDSSPSKTDSLGQSLCRKKKTESVLSAK